MTESTQPFGDSALTPDQERRLAEFLEVTGRLRGHIGFVCCPFLTLNAVERFLSSRTFHCVDCELFRARASDTSEFCELIAWDRHDAFALFVPRLIPTRVCCFLYNAADNDLVCAESSYPPEGSQRKLNEKSWLVIMTPEDFDDAAMENGWDRYKLTRALSYYCRLDW